MVQSYCTADKKVIENDFPYRTLNREVRQNNAAISAGTVMQDFYWLPHRYHRLSAHFWYDDFDREIQPHLQDFDNEDQLDYKNWRGIVKWNFQGPRFRQDLALGYTRDRQLYNRDDRISVTRFHSSWRGQLDFSPRFNITSQTRIDALTADVEAFQEPRQEVRSTKDVGLLWLPKDHWNIAVNASVPFLDNRFQTFSPLASGRKRVFANKQIALYLNGQFGRSFRFPTLNDLYWRPGGNPNLKPETAWNTESGISLELRKIGLTTDVRYFNHQVDNWIIWIPGGRQVNDDGSVSGFWYPTNIREVSAQGVEFMQDLSWTNPDNKWGMQMDIQATYQNVRNKNQLNPLDRSQNRQLPYTPKWLWNATLNLQHQAWAFFVQSQYRSTRYVEANNELPGLEPYTLWAIGLQRGGKLGKLQWQLQAQVANLLNTEYQTFENRAMPGRSWDLKLIVKS